MDDLVERQQMLDKVLNQNVANPVVDVRKKENFFTKLFNFLKVKFFKKDEPLGLQGFMSSGFKIL